MANYLVTGVAGFIAARTAELLLAAGHIVVGVDNLNNYYDVRLKDYRLTRLLGEASWHPGADRHRSLFAGGGRWSSPDGRFIFEAVDIEDLAALERLFVEFRFDGVFNLAARAGVVSSMKNPHVYLTTNALGTLNILECQKKHGVKKLVQASTSSLYAGCPLPFTEDQPVNNPLSPYAASKKAAEVMAYSYHHLYGLDVTVVRYFTVYGPAGRPDMSVFRFIRWIDQGQPLELFGDGTQSRDFTYLDDIARGTILAAKPLGYEIINLGGGDKPVTLQQVIAFLEKELGKTARITGQPFQAADMKATWADITKAGRLLGWTPRIALEDGLRQCIEWYHRNAGWLNA